MNADGTGKHWARSLPSSFHISGPSWSKDGARLVITVWVGSEGRLALMDVATGNLTYVNAALGGTIGYGASFDPTGQRIVYAGLLADTLHMINTDGSGHKVVVGWQSVSSPRFSPDGEADCIRPFTAGRELRHLREEPCGRNSQAPHHERRGGLGHDVVS